MSSPPASSRRTDTVPPRVRMSSTIASPQAAAPLIKSGPRRPCRPSSPQAPPPPTGLPRAGSRRHPAMYPACRVRRDRRRSRPNGVTSQVDCFRQPFAVASQRVEAEGLLPGRRGPLLFDAEVMTVASMPRTIQRCRCLPATAGPRETTWPQGESVPHMPTAPGADSYDPREYHVVEGFQRAAHGRVRGARPEQAPTLCGITAASAAVSPVRSAGFRSSTAHTTDLARLMEPSRHP